MDSFVERVHQAFLNSLFFYSGSILRFDIQSVALFANNLIINRFSCPLRKRRGRNSSAVHGADQAKGG